MVEFAIRLKNNEAARTNRLRAQWDRRERGGNRSEKRIADGMD